MTREDINKACNWLNDHLWLEIEFPCGLGTLTLKYDAAKDFIERFKEAMEA